MKNILLLLSLVLFASSCRIIKMGNPVPAHPQPFVQLKNGQKIEATTVSYDKYSIIADHKEYPMKKVSFYSDGEKTYTNSPKNTFLTLVSTGDINIYNHTFTYQSVNSSTGASVPRTVSINYFQKSGANESYSLSYKNLKKFIQSGDPGYDNMRLYRKNRIIGQSMFYGGLALFFTGVTIAANNTSVNGVSTEQARGQRVGGVVLSVGMLSFLNSAIVKGLNYRNLQRAVGKHNGVIEK